MAWSSYVLVFLFIFILGTVGVWYQLIESLFDKIERLYRKHKYKKESKKDEG